jgi:hypothetical protein
MFKKNYLLLLLINCSIVNAQIYKERKINELKINSGTVFNYTNDFEVTQVFSDSTAYGLTYKFKTEKQPVIYIGNSMESLNYNEIELDRKQRLDNDMIKTLSKPIYVNRNGFIGMIELTFSKKGFNTYALVFKGRRINKIGFTKIDYIINSKNEIITSKHIEIINFLTDNVKQTDIE